MSDKNSQDPKVQPRTNPLIWLGVMALAAALVLLVFIALYKKGASVGELAPKIEKKVKAESAAAAVDLEKLKTFTPELVSKGAALFQINCASCHGPKGEGDGPRAAELNPRPRNFHSETFRFGAFGSQIFNTVTNGSPGTSMPSFALLPPEDRWALVHFVRSQIPDAPEESPKQAETKTAQPKETETASQAQTAAELAKAELVQGPRIPILLAMQRMAEPTPPMQPLSVLSLEKEGAVLFSRYCMPCHGPAGESRQTVYLLRINPDRFVRSGNLQNPKAAWVEDENRFQEIVTRGFPGHLMPGLKTLKESELDALYSHVLKLATTANR